MAGLAELVLLAAVQPYFCVKVVDAETGRGVPMVELRTLNEVRYITDSAGVAAIHEPAWGGREVAFKIRAHGYEYPARLFIPDEPGAVLHVRHGGAVTLKIRRKNIAERLYRVTGEGIYRDSQLAGLPAPITTPDPNGLVVGQDSVAAAIYEGRIFWIWGDTTGLKNFNFAVAAATSKLPAQGGLDPSVGVDLAYFLDSEGFARRMLDLRRPGLVWIEGLFTATDPQGHERLLATYTRQQGLKPPDERGLAVFSDARGVFEPLAAFPWPEGHESSHPFRHDGHIYLYPWLRVPDRWEAIIDPSKYERRPVQLPEGLHHGSVQWNGYRRRFILLAQRKPGEVFYAEASQPEGPFGKPVLIVSHDNYNFYNVAHHPFFDQEGGRVIYFEGTYTAAFSEASEKTPRYDYNQIMYRLRLDHERLIEARSQ